MTFNPAGQHRTRPRSRWINTVESQLNFGTRTWTGRYNGTLSPNWALTVNYSNYYNSFTEYASRKRL